jgi:hypothetical protein
MRKALKNLAITTILVALTSCGSSDSGGSGGGSPDSPNLDNQSCSEIWAQIIKNHPKGRKLTYEGFSLGRFEKTEILIEDSKDLSYTEATTITTAASTTDGIEIGEESRTTRHTELKSVYIDNCEKARSTRNQPSSESGSYSHSADTSNDPEPVKESKTTRAGAFATYHAQVTMRSTINGEQSITETDLWFNDNPFDSFTVFEKSVTKYRDQSFDSAKELVSIVTP